MRNTYRGAPCPHYPHLFRTEEAHIGRLASKKRHHDKKKAERAARRFASDLYPLRLRIQKLLCTIRQRVTRGNYAAKGIECRLTFNDVLTAWDRDGAEKMNRPSIDRIDNNGDYEASNIRFIELADNIRRGVKARMEKHSGGVPAREKAVA